MADRYHSDTQERVEVLAYTPDIQNSGDLEAATKTVTATAKPGAADYSASLTIPAPSDARWLVKRAGVRLQITVDSIPAGHFYGSLYVNGVERKTFDLTGTGDKPVVQDLTEGQFNIGTANSFGVYLWVDAGQAVVSLCQVWQAVGSTDTGFSFPFCLQLLHKGFAQWMIETNRIGTGTGDLRIGQGDGCRPSCYNTSFGVYSVLSPPTILSHDCGVSMRVNNVGDLGGFYNTIKTILRSSS
ncbi:MAG: hypothetical protein C4542_02755 [Dehalococcoidia bacterium]|nr:MAG: hypothetical protein C4542_02755 [Dehalococcoidia bacterium]